jgi:hypothetical protein
MAKIDAGEINSIRLKEQGSDPSTPASGYGQLYAKSDGLYFRGDGGTVVGPFGTSGGAATYVGARVKRTSNQTGVVTATWTSIAFDVEDNDSDAFHDTSTNNSRLTVPSGKAGRYDIVGHFAWESNATGLRYARVLLNGTTILTLDTQAPVSGDVTTHTVVVPNYDLIVGDYVEVQGFQTSGANRQIVADTTTTGSPRFALRQVG